MGDSAGVPKALSRKRSASISGTVTSRTSRVVQAITLVAHQANKDPDVRFAREQLATTLATLTARVAASPRSRGLEIQCSPFIDELATGASPHALAPTIAGEVR